MEKDIRASKILLYTFMTFVLVAVVAMYYDALVFRNYEILDDTEEEELIDEDE